VRGVLSRRGLWGGYVVGYLTSSRFGSWWVRMGFQSERLGGLVPHTGFRFQHGEVSSRVVSKAAAVLTDGSTPVRVARRGRLYHCKLQYRKAIESRLGLRDACPACGLPFFESAYHLVRLLTSTV
jgi:hypothetical protein